MGERLAALQRAWNGFWFAEASPVALALFRILFAGVLVFEMPTSQLNSAFALEGGFHLPYPWSPPLLSPRAYEAFHVAQLPLALFLGLGLFTRTSCIGLLLVKGWIFFADQLNFINHPYFFLLVLLLLAVSPCADRLSLDASLRRAGPAPRDPPRASPLGAQRLLQVQISLVYLFAGLQKCNAEFLGGYALAHLTGENLLSGASGAILGAVFSPETLASWEGPLALPSHFVAIAWATVALELGLSVALWHPLTRVPAMLAGAGFHVSIALTMDIFTFSAAMLASYLLFADPERLAARWERLAAWRVRGASEAPA